MDNKATSFSPGHYDELIFGWFNQWNGRYGALDTFLGLSEGVYVKALPFMLVIWALWFLPSAQHDRTASRERLTAVLLAALPIIAITRALANFLPYSVRPLHSKGLAVNLREGQSPVTLDGWSSMPSDHASLFIGLAVGILFVDRRFGALALFWAVFAVSLPRIVGGFHWPSDILVGALSGGGLALVLVPLLTRFVRWARIVPFFQAREALGYPLLFLATFEIAQMFHATRAVVRLIMG
ncbi:phosphatase PAP2 family protein [Thalassovita aquimarina]|uniref:Phosphatase PAP2 family protein n=1 Tax=Thalassovita aquimarina TaxID=2785917 RepID=A0ABS5HMM6_9RHOB|nr:phosphatase PAP2 family protein [Thalassovita aquimarina]MBR9650174.1 phosphatase PAP2 family protein [Thalassovita aquimarina]